MPDFKQIVRDRLAQLGLAAGDEADLTEEISQHLEDRYRDLIAGGASEDAACKQASAEMEDCYPIGGRRRLPKYEIPPVGHVPAGSFVEGLWKDLQYALRSMRKSPVFALFVVLTLAIGIGANTTVFTVINTLILNPLPVQKMDELVGVAASATQDTSRSKTFYPMSYINLKDYESRNEVFTSLAGFADARPATFEHQGAAQGIFIQPVTANFFPTLGIQPSLGRFFSSDEDSPDGAHPVAVLNYAAWQQRFGADPEIVGRELKINSVVLTVVGVAPPRFIGISAIFGPDLWVPAGMVERMFPNSMQNALTDRGKAGFMGMGRLKPGVTLSQAQANVRTIGAALAKAYPVNEGHASTAVPVLDFTLNTGGSSRAPMLFGSFALLAVVGIVLLVACSNVANLLLARSAARRQEMAVRLAMGASRPRLIRQLLTESVLLGLLSGAAGMLLANQGLQFLFSRLPQSANFPTPKTDVTVFVFALGVSLAAGFLFGTIPALKASRANPAEWLKESARTAGRSRSRITASSALLVGQVAFSFLLIVMATLFLRSISRAYQIDPGFQTDHLAVFTTNPGQAGYTRARSIAFYRDVRERVERIPGVESMSWSSNMPLWAASVSGFGIESRQQRSRTDEVRAVLTTVDVDFFETSGVLMRSGRPFSKADQENSLPVAIVNEKMAADFWPKGAIGKRIQLPGEKVARQVVGVARTANYTGWGEPPQSCVYVPLQQKFVDAMILYVRSKGDPGGLLMPVQRELRAAGPQVMVMSSRTGAEVVWGGLFMPRMGVGLLTAFGFLALALASIGLYGVIAYSVAQRKREIGLRMALGATRSSVLRLVLREGMSLVAVGVVLGLTGALAAGRLLSSLLFGLGVTDPLSFGAAALVLCVASLAACYLPARGATRVDPIEALREV